MIVLEDGNKRLPTKEEILENVRRSSRTQRIQQPSERIENDSSSVNEQNRYSSAEDRQLFGERQGTPRPYNRGTGIDESLERGYERTNGDVPNESGQVGRSDNLNNQYRERFTTGSTTTDATYVPPIKKSKFRPYTDAIKEAIKESTNRKKDSPGDIKTKQQRKIFTEAEVKGNREKLIEVLLWQSEHADELIIATTKGHIQTIIIWSNIDRHEAGILADWLLRAAKRDARVAFAVREMLEIQNRLEVAIIVLPRMYKTFMTYAQYGFSIR